MSWYAARHVIRVEPFDVYFLLSQDLRDRIQQFLHPLTGMGRGGNALLRAEVAVSPVFLYQVLFIKDRDNWLIACSQFIQCLIYDMHLRFHLRT